MNKWNLSTIRSRRSRCVHALGIALGAFVLAIAGACSGAESGRVGDIALKLTEPLDGSTVRTGEITLRGLAPANAEVRRDISWGADDSFRANGEGVWEYKTKLDRGENQFEFFLQNSKDTRLKVKLIYDPSVAEAAGSPSPTDNPRAGDNETATPEPVLTAAPTPPPVPTQPQMTVPPATPLPEWITGLSAVDVTGNLENQGLVCAGPRQMQTLVSWDCSAANGIIEYWVSVMGLNATHIRSISATVSNSSGAGDDQVAARFLGYVASVPYDDGNPSQAQQWVRTNIASGGDRVIGSARFSLSGPPTARSLEIVAIGAN